MSVKIRLKRMGTKKRPFYRIVATDSRNRRDGRFIEELGFYDPLAVPPTPAVKVSEELFFKWLKCGAIPSENVENIVRRLGIMKKWQLVRAGVPAEQIEEKLAAVIASETKGATPEERRRKFVQKRTAKKAAAAPAEGA